jgi:hypothetical protein
MIAHIARLDLPLEDYLFGAAASDLHLPNPKATQMIQAVREKKPKTKLLVS